jgi:AcrR family transcriptional regulator
VSALPNHAGRPRDARLDDAIMRSALEVFLERGYARTSLSEVARRAGVGTPAIYRRWPTKAALAIDVTVREQMEEPIPDTGSIRDDLVEFLRLRIRIYGTRLFQQVMAPVLLEAAAEPRLKETIGDRFVDYRKPLLARLRHAIDSGELRADTEPARLLDLLMGTVSMPLLFAQPLPVESESESIVDQVLAGFATDSVAARRSMPD